MVTTHKNKEYYLNPLIKRINLSEDYTEDQVKEYVRCAQDPEYFIEKYVKINSLDHGFIPFKLRGYQKGLIKSFHENRRVVLLSPRQSGKCFFINTIVTVRNKITGEIKQSTIGDFYENIKNRDQTM